MPTLPNLRDYQARGIDKINNHIASLDGTHSAYARSFVVVCPTGGGKCISPDSWVWSSGLKRFSDAWDSTKIAGMHKTDRVTGWWDDGVNDGLKISTAAGWEIDGTLAHRVWARKPDGEERWFYLTELVEGDYIAFGRGRADFGENPIDDRDAYFLGLLIADGCLTKSHQSVSYRLQFDKHPNVVEIVAPLLSRFLSQAEELYKDRPTCAKVGSVRTHQESPNHAVAHVSHIKFKELLKNRYGCELPCSENREVPSSILRGSRENISSFLRGYFDGDGWCDKIIACSSASRVLSEQIGMLLLGLGVACTIRTKIVTGGLPAHIVTIVDIDAYVREVGFTSYGVIKDTNLLHLLSKKRNTNIDIVPGVGNLMRRAGKTAKQVRHCKAPRFSTYWSGSKNPSYSTFKILAGLLPDSDEKTEMTRIISENRFWVKVANIEPSRIHRIDCEVEGSQSFIANGIVNHNTELAVYLMLKALEQGQRSLFVLDDKTLTAQTASRLGRYDALCGIISASLDKGKAQGTDPRNLIQVSSIGTLVNRPKPTGVKLVFMDECHINGFGPGQRWWAETNPDGAWKHWDKDCTVIGLTATPWRMKRTESLSDLYSHCIVVAQPKELIELGKTTKFTQGLTQPIYYGFKSVLDLSECRTQMGDYRQSDLAVVLDDDLVRANTVAQWKKLCLEPRGGILKHARKAIFYGAGVAASQRLADAFNDDAELQALARAEGYPDDGILFKMLSGDDEIDEREHWFKRMQERNELVGFANANLLVKGVDIPEIEFIWLPPTKSPNRKTQIEGRGARCAPWIGKRDFIIVDSGLSTMKLGRFDEEQDYSILPKPVKQSQEAPMKQCPECDKLLYAFQMQCECGYEFPPSAEKNVALGNLVKLLSRTDKVFQTKYRRFAHDAYAKGYSPNWALLRVQEDMAVGIDRDTITVGQLIKVRREWLYTLDKIEKATVSVRVTEVLGIKPTGSFGLSTSLGECSIPADMVSVMLVPNAVPEAMENARPWRTDRKDLSPHTEKEMADYWLHLGKMAKSKSYDETWCLTWYRTEFGDGAKHPALLNFQKQQKSA
jgi:DNA repair protein RadD